MAKIKEFDTKTRKTKIVHSVDFGSLGVPLPPVAGGKVDRKDPSERPRKEARNFSERYF